MLNHFNWLLFTASSLLLIVTLIPPYYFTKLPSDNKQQKQQTYSFTSKEDIFFQISEPESLRYTFKARSSRIGVPFDKVLQNHALVLVEPHDGCSPVIDKLELKGNIALVQRGGCSFLEKCIEIERSRGIALIVYDNDRHNDENYIEMIDDDTSRNCSIPAVSLLGKDGHMISQALLVLRLNRAIITIPVYTAFDKKSNPPWLTWIHHRTRLYQHHAQDIKATSMVEVQL